MEKQNLTIGFITEKDPNDRRSWSGTHYRMLVSLKKSFTDVIVLGPVKLPRFIEKVLSVIERLIFKLFKKKYSTSHCLIRSVYYGYYFKKKLRQHRIDLIYAPAASIEIAFLKTDIPIFYLSDTSFKQINDYYANYSNLSKISYLEANIIEKRSIRKSACQIYSSGWAADFVKKYYKAKNTHVIKFGANIDDTPDIASIQKNKDDKFNLLFLGVDWIRKGGDIVLETLKLLDTKGYNVDLTVCGCIPPENHPKMKVIPFLNKNKPDEREAFSDILCKTKLLFVPTRADCTPIVFCEANAFGIPVLTTNTGGVNAIIEDGVNGYSLAFDATPEDYADKIVHLIKNPDILNNLYLSSRNKYENELNWDTWGRNMTNVMLDVLKTS